MQKTLLEMANNIALMAHLDEATGVIGNESKNAKVILLCINQGIDRDVWRANAWSTLRRFYSFVEVPQKRSYELPDDFGWYVNDTAWNITTEKPMVGPLDPHQWQIRTIPNTLGILDLVAFTFAGVSDQWSIGGNQTGVPYSPRIIIDPEPFPDGAPVSSGGVGYFPQTFSIAYISRNIVVDQNGTAKNEFTEDTDRPIIDSSVIEQAGLVRLKRSLGIPFADDMDELQSLILNWRRKESGMKRMSAVNKRRSFRRRGIGIGSTGFGFGGGFGGEG